MNDKFVVFKNEGSEESKNSSQTLIQMSLVSMLQYCLHNAYIEFRRRTCQFALAFLSVAVVVLAAVVAQSIIDRAPIIFLSSAESQQGQRDFEIFAASGTLNPGSFALQSLLNLTRINDLLDYPRNQLTSPRFVMEGYFVGPADKEDLFCSIDASSPESIFLTGNQCKLSDHSGKVAFIDQIREKQIGLGTQWQIVDLKPGEAVVSTAFTTSMGVNVGDMLYFKTNDYLIIASNILEAKCGPYYISTFCQELKIALTNIKDRNFQETPQEFFSVIPLRVAGFFSSDGGKFAQDRPELQIVTDYKYLVSYPMRYLEPTNDLLKAANIITFIELAEGESPDQYAQIVSMNLPNRESAYLNGNFDELQFQVTGFGSQVVNDLGVYAVELNWLVLNELYALRFSSMFLSIVLNIIIVVLFALSVMLLYNLLLVSIETKTYELGVLRVLGLNKQGIIALVFTQSLSYVIPAVFTGFIISFLLLSIVMGALASTMGMHLSSFPTSNSIIFGLIVGFLIPLVASITPIHEALKQTLSSSLDQQRSKSQAVKISIDLEGNATPWGLITFASIGSFFGISIYYLLPLALISFDFALLINIFFIILIGLLVGCVVLSLNVQYLIEKAVVFMCFFWLKAGVRAIVVKNMAAHRIKNRRASVMYGLSIAFVIFVWTTMMVQLESTDFEVRQKYGASMTVMRTYNNFLNPAFFERIIVEQLSDCVISHAWVTYNLNGYLIEKDGLDINFMTHPGRVYEVFPMIVGVSPGFLSTAFSSDFLTVLESSDSSLDIVEELYTPRGSQSVILNEMYRDILLPTLEPSSSLLNVAYKGTRSRAFETRVSAIVSKMPGLIISNLGKNTRQHVLVSLPSFLNMVKDLVDSAEELPMEKLLLKFHPECRQRLSDTMTKEIADNRQPARVWDYTDVEKVTVKQKKVINIIFSALCVIVMALSFFSLISSMTANILEQTKEIAVLRAVGITKLAMKLVYFYEAFALVFSSCIIGCIIGLVIGLMMSLQRALFTDLPIQFAFPYLIFIIMFIVAIICALVSTIAPTSHILKYQIAAIVRLTS